MQRQRPTIDDVARLAGVGRTTVSRVVNQGPFVRAEVREKVLRAVATLGYRANVQARSLASGASREIALIHATSLECEPNSYYSSGLELGAMRGCAEHGFQLSNHGINQTSPDHAERIAALMVEGRFRGVILTPPFSDNARLIRKLTEMGAQVVCISAGPQGLGAAPSVGIDDAAAGYDITRHLLELGHRRFGFLHGLPGHLSADGRYAGFRRALAAAAVDPAGVAEGQGNFTFHGGIEQGQRILERPDRPTALVCANDDSAAGAMLAAHKLGLDIPGDVSITGFDDTPVSQIVWPPLTTIHQPIRELARRAVDLIEAGPIEPRHEMVGYHLALRDSTGSPRQ